MSIMKLAGLSLPLIVASHEVTKYKSATSTYYSDTSIVQCLFTCRVARIILTWICYCSSLFSPFILIYIFFLFVSSLFSVSESETQVRGRLSHRQTWINLHDRRYLLLLCKQRPHEIFFLLASTLLGVKCVCLFEFFFSILLYTCPLHFSHADSNKF